MSRSPSRADSPRKENAFTPQTYHHHHPFPRTVSVFSRSLLLLHQLIDLQKLTRQADNYCSLGCLHAHISYVHLFSNSLPCPKKNSLTERLQSVKFIPTLPFSCFRMSSHDYAPSSLSPVLHRLIFLSLMNPD